MNRKNCNLCEFKSAAAAQLKGDELELLSKNCAQVEFKNGDTIFKQNALSSNIIYIQRGFIKIHMQGPDRESILRISKAPTYLGIPTTVGDRINHYSATALTSVIACFIDINAFKKFIFRNGNFAYEIILDLCKNELHHFHRCINLTQKQLNGRIADSLLFLADEIFKINEFEMLLNRNELADFVGSSRESVSRVLNQFHEEGIIHMNGKFIRLLKRQVLETISRTG
jgi:CRP/FNR family transcriptional regulator